MSTPFVRILAALLVCLAGCDGGGGGRGGNTSSAGEDAEHQRPVSRSVEIGKTELFVDCRGSGSPTVVLEAGLTGDHHVWDQVQPAVARRTRVCSYDRANTGASLMAPTPRTAQDIVVDLQTLLDKVGERPPYVLVGFSFGGIFTQLYAKEHRAEVAGMVLVESNHPDENRQFWAHLTRSQIAEDRQQANANPEGVDVFTSFSQVRQAGPLPKVPLVVVTAGRPVEWPPGWDRQVFDRLRTRQQADLVKMVPGGEQVIARRSGHEVPVEQPHVVIDAIHSVLRQSG